MNTTQNISIFYTFLASFQNVTETTSQSELCTVLQNTSDSTLTIKLASRYPLTIASFLAFKREGGV